MLTARTIRNLFAAIICCATAIGTACRSAVEHNHPDLQPKIPMQVVLNGSASHGIPYAVEFFIEPLGRNVAAESNANATDLYVGLNAVISTEYANIINGLKFEPGRQYVICLRNISDEFTTAKLFTMPSLPDSGPNHYLYLNITIHWLAEISKELLESIGADDESGIYDATLLDQGSLAISWELSPNPDFPF